MTESKTLTSAPDQSPEASPENDDERRKKEEYEAVKSHVRRLLFGVSCMDCKLKRQKS